MKNLLFSFLMLVAVAFPTNFTTASTFDFDVDHSVTIAVSVNGTVHSVTLNSTNGNCPSPGLGLLTITSASTNQTLVSTPLMPNGNSWDGEVIVVGSFTNGGVIVSSLTGKSLHFTYTYGGCLYTGSL